MGSRFAQTNIEIGAMAKKSRKKITYKIKRNQSDWALSKLMEDQMGLWLADSFEQYEKEQENIRTNSWAVGNDDNDDNLARFFDLIYHFVDDIPENDYSFDVYGRYFEALQALADIENTYRVIERTIDFDINLLEKLKRLEKDFKLGGPVRRILTDQEFNHLQSISDDARLFELDFNAPRNDLFHLLLRADRSIQDHEAISDDVLPKLKKIQRLRSSGRPRKYSTKLLIILLAEVFEKFNKLGHNAGIKEKEDFKYGEEAYSSPFWAFMKDYFNVIGINTEFKTEYEMAGYAKEILTHWRRNRKKFHRINKGSYYAEEVAEIIRNIDKYIK